MGVWYILWCLTKGTVFTTHPPQTAHNTRHVGETFGPTFPNASNSCLRPSVMEEECTLPPLPLGAAVGFNLLYVYCLLLLQISYPLKLTACHRLQGRETLRIFQRERGCGCCLSNAVIFYSYTAGCSGSQQHPGGLLLLRLSSTERIDCTESCLV